MKIEKLSDGTPLEEGMRFYLLEDTPDQTIKELVLVKNENYPMYATREWLFIDEDGEDHSDEWYFFDGAYLQRID